ncbi:MAG TPA: hypothetical protein VGN14_08315 [Candidatus Elarobacter sp.]|jgi:hypothetical protein
MKVAIVVARILLGLIFVVLGAFGASTALGIGPPLPALPGFAGQFNDVIFKSHFVLFVQVIQIFSGILLLVNRYVVLALVLLGAVLYNIFAFHLTMNIQMIVLPIVTFALWLFLAFRYRAYLMVIFTPKAVPDVPQAAAGPRVG